MVARGRPQSLVVRLVADMREPLVDVVELRAVLDMPLRALDSWDDNVDEEPVLLLAELNETPAAGPELGGSDRCACTHHPHHLALFHTAEIHYYVLYSPQMFGPL